MKKKKLLLSLLKRKMKIKGLKETFGIAGMSVGMGIAGEALNSEGLKQGGAVAGKFIPVMVNVGMGFTWCICRN